MKITARLAPLALGGVLGTLSVPACSLDVPDLNNPGLDVLENSPTAVLIGAACTGLLIGNRRNQAAEAGYVLQLGILGREAYNFDTADSRYIGELLAGKLSQGSPFGGNFWLLPYVNIRLANVVRHALDKVGPDLSDQDKLTIRGFVSTIEALDLLEVIVTHDTIGAVIDTDQPIVLPPAIQPLGAIVDKPVVLTEIARLLDSAVADLSTPGGGFPFLFDEGYTGFDTPKTFLKFNRAIRARVAAYMKDYDTALTALGASFLDDTSPAAMLNLDTGVYYTYTTKPGDVQNGLINPNIFAHPALQTDAMKNGSTVDARFTRKVTPALNKDGTIKTVKAGNINSSLVFTAYSSPSSPVPLIRNEELILLKAEALFFKTPSDPTGALAELNIVRTKSGGLVALLGTPDEATFVDELLYERRYSLMLEWGHRWIDTRRFSRSTDLPLEDTDPMFKLNVRYPLPLPECNARPGEPRCMLGST